MAMPTPKQVTDDVLVKFENEVINTHAKLLSDLPAGTPAFIRDALARSTQDMREMVGRMREARQRTPDIVFDFDEMVERSKEHLGDLIGKQVKVTSPLEYDFLHEQWIREGHLDVPNSHASEVKKHIMCGRRTMVAHGDWGVAEVERRGDRYFIIQNNKPTGEPNGYPSCNEAITMARQYVQY